MATQKGWETAQALERGRRHGDPAQSVESCCSVWSKDEKNFDEIVRIDKEWWKEIWNKYPVLSPSHLTVSLSAMSNQQPEYELSFVVAALQTPGTEAAMEKGV